VKTEKTIITKNGTFILRPYTDSDMESVIELWETAFNNKIDKKIWEWKYHHNPFGRQIILCLNSNGKPIAMYGGTPFFVSQLDLFQNHSFLEYWLLISQ